MIKRRYNYVIFGSSWDLYLHSYADIMNLDDVRYIPESIRSNMMKESILYHIHLGRINNYVQLPFKGIWNHFYFKDDFVNKRPLCFIFTGSWTRINRFIGLTDYLKKKHPNSKNVCFFTDLVETQNYPYTSESFDANFEKKYYDLMLSFDHGDCEKYGFLYHPLVYSVCSKVDNIEIENDIYFLGQAKNRFDEIIHIYEKLREQGMKMDINIVGVPECNQKYNNEIHYLDSFMSYDENLQHLLRARCLLEIMQKNGCGYTQRCVEAIGENKKLLTNNLVIKKAQFYNEKYISTFSSANDLDSSFISRIPSHEEVNYNYRDNISPIELLNFIDSAL